MKLLCAGVLLVVFALTACGDGSETPGGEASPTPVATATATPTAIAQKPADADSPAAGICADVPAGDVVTVALNVDVPDPRCVKVIPLQRLRVVNNTGQAITVELGRFRVEMAPGGEQTLDASFGEYLAPGVHRVKTSAPPGGPELWLVAGGK